MSNHQHCLGCGGCTPADGPTDHTEPAGPLRGAHLALAAGGLFLAPVVLAAAAAAFLGGSPARQWLAAVAAGGLALLAAILAAKALAPAHDRSGPQTDGGAAEPATIVCEPLPCDGRSAPN